MKLRLEKKNLHVELPRASYIKLRIASFERELGASEVFAGFTALIANQDERAFQILDELALMKYRGTLQKHINSQMLSDVDSALLYDLMEKGETP